MRKILLALLIGLVACTATTPQGDLVTPQHDRSSQVQQMMVVVYPNEEALNRAYDKFAKKDMPDVLGWSAWSADVPGQCVIHVTKPERLGTDRVETWGHELLHCVYGSFHP